MRAWVKVAVVSILVPLCAFLIFVPVIGVSTIHHVSLPSSPLPYLGCDISGDHCLALGNITIIACPCYTESITDRLFGVGGFTSRGSYHFTGL